jgi:hypothetical protein
MTGRFPVLSVPGPVGSRSLGSRARRRALRDYAVALLQPRDRTKTLTALARAEPLVGACHRGCSGGGGSCPNPLGPRGAGDRRGVDLLLGLADEEPGIPPGLGSLGQCRESVIMRDGVVR